jgi:hypothetical protein
MRTWPSFFDCWQQCIVYSFGNATNGLRNHRVSDTANQLIINGGVISDGGIKNIDEQNVCWARAGTMAKEPKHGIVGRPMFGGGIKLSLKIWKTRQPLVPAVRGFVSACCAIYISVV